MVGARGPARFGLPGIGVPKDELFARAGDHPASVIADLAGDAQWYAQITHALAVRGIPQPKIGEKIVSGDAPASARRQSITRHRKILRELARTGRICIWPKPECR